MNHIPSGADLCKEVSLIREYLNRHGLQTLTYFEFEHMIEVLDNVLNYIAKEELGKS